jgi:predicted porin
MKKFIPGALTALVFAYLTSVVLWSGAARAGDLGGSCCHDLEERVAELEATTAKKGNRKVTLEIYGQVSRAILWADAIRGRDIDNPNSGSRFGFTGGQKIDAKTSAGYVIEVGVGTVSDTSVVLRKSALWVDTAFGKLTLGRFDAATKGISEISFANANIANLPSTIYGTVVDASFSNLIRYDTPTIGGFTGSVSRADDKNLDAALRYAAQFDQIRAAAGIGYAEISGGTRYSGSASVMHTPSGLFLNGVYGVRTLDGDTNSIRAYHLTGGLETTLNSLGKSTFYGEYGRLSYLDAVGKGWGVGAVQAIDAAAMDVFASFRRLEADDAKAQSVVMTGARIKF